MGWGGMGICRFSKAGSQLCRAIIEVVGIGAVGDESLDEPAYLIAAVNVSFNGAVIIRPSCPIIAVVRSIVGCAISCRKFIGSMVVVLHDNPIVICPIYGCNVVKSDVNPLVGLRDIDRFACQQCGWNANVLTTGNPIVRSLLEIASVIACF